MGLHNPILRWHIFEESYTLDVSLRHFIKVGYDKINELSYFKCYIPFCINKLRGTPIELG